MLNTEYSDVNIEIQLYCYKHYFWMQSKLSEYPLHRGVDTIPAKQLNKHREYVCSQAKRIKVMESKVIQSLKMIRK